MSSDGLDPRAPHWFEFNRINELPNDWTFEVLDWDGDPDADGVDDRGEAEVTRGDHRFVITTWLQPRARTHDRYWSIAYETVNQDDEPEPLSFHIGRTQAIARNNLGHARDSIDTDGVQPHVLVRDHRDGPRETFEFPTPFMAEKAADLQTRLKMDHDDRDYLATVHSKDEWQDRLERERAVQTDGGHRLSTDRVDGTILAECPNKEYADDNHLSATVEYGDAVDNNLYEEFVGAFDVCGECGAELDYIAHEEPTEVLE